MSKPEDRIGRLMRLCIIITGPASVVGIPMWLAGQSMFNIVVVVVLITLFLDMLIDRLG